MRIAGWEVGPRRLGCQRPPAPSRSTRPHASNCGSDSIAGDKRLYDAVSNNNKEFVEIIGATHYYLGQHEQLQKAEQACTQWLRRQGLTDL